MDLTILLIRGAIKKCHKKWSPKRGEGISNQNQNCPQKLSRFSDFFQIQMTDGCYIGEIQAHFGTKMADT